MLSANELLRIVAEARNFLRPLIKEELAKYPDFWGPWVTKSPDEIIELHLQPEHTIEAATRKGILSGILWSAQNRRGANKVISGCLMNGWQDLGTMLHDFDAEAILRDWETPGQLFAYFRKMHDDGRISGKLLNSKRSLWPIFCQTVLSAAHLVAQYRTAEDFIEWLESFRQKPETAAALPLVLAQEIDGFGLALACDFLKELGCTEFPKPDTHINYLAGQLGISTAESDYRMMLDIRRAADDIGMTAYAFDKIFWLVGSGRFYRVEVGRYILDIGRQADNFLAYMETVPWRDDPQPALATA
ncbi:hypothetical protein [Shumkonia mesophila]|uniref:hypothetical protein n=1 Tax=Shumkonia mesophila TaxID=2838854 RepID=UPI0029348D6B|nr:hypothetical protein [Shumkonia mesophila]